MPIAANHGRRSQQQTGKFNKAAIVIRLIGIFTNAQTHPSMDISIAARTQQQHDNNNMQASNEFYRAANVFTCSKFLNPNKGVHGQASTIFKQQLSNDAHCSKSRQKITAANGQVQQSSNCHSINWAATSENPWSIFTNVQTHPSMDISIAARTQQQHDNNNMAASMAPTDIPQNRALTHNIMATKIDLKFLWQTK
ncbi:hypothetical protein ACLOJK_024305 [Asimina triloba]